MSIYIHTTAIVDSQKIGEGSRIWAFVHILENVNIGKNANICDHCFIEGGVFIGDDVTIKCGVWIWNGVTIENNVFVGPSVVFTNDVYPRSKNKVYKKENTLLKEGCSVGGNSTLIGGITIGRYAMVGAGSVVTKDVNDFELVYGNPAKLKGYICKCGEKIEFKDRIIECPCGLKYKFEDGKISEI